MIPKYTISESHEKWQTTTQLIYSENFAFFHLKLSRCNKNGLIKYIIDFTQYLTNFFNGHLVPLITNFRNKDLFGI